MIDDEALKSIEKLHEMNASGIISDEEYAQAKQRLLADGDNKRSLPKFKLDAALIENLKTKLRGLKPKQWVLIVGSAVVLLILILTTGGEIGCSSGPMDL